MIDDEVYGLSSTGSSRLPAPRPELTEPVAAERLLETLEEAVRLRLMSDVPLGAMLSGGLDSSLLVALMARNMSDPVETFSVGFAEDDVRSELGDAALVANALGTKHHELELSMRDSAVELEDLVWALDEPLADLSALGFLALSELAARHVTVAIAGQGADELFGGYPRHWRAGLVERAQVVPRPLARFGAARLGSGRYGRFANAIAATDPAHRYLSLRTPFFDPRPAPASCVTRCVRTTAVRARSSARTARMFAAGLVPRRCTSIRGSASSTTCCTTSTGCRWRIHSRCASPSSTTR